jgi:archaellum component FlaC
MSSSDDSETAEWEREQMLRGTQSRARHQRQNPTGNQKSTPSASAQVEQKPDVLNATVAKHHVQNDIEEVEREIEATKRSIGSARVDIVRSKKRIEAMMRQIEKLEASNPIFEGLQKLTDPNEILAVFEKHKQMIAQLPADQKEMMDLLEGRIRGTSTPMVVDSDD